MIVQALMAAGEPLIVVDSADFDGTADSMARGAGLTNAADGKKGTLSFWFRVDGGDGAAQVIMEDETSQGIFVARQADNTIFISGRNSAGTLILTMGTTATFTTDASWHHLFASWDLAATTGHLYIDGVSDIALTTFTDDTIDYTRSDFFCGHSGSKINMALAEVYFNQAEYLNPAIPANLRRFRSGSGKPAFLGTTGQIPTGTAPIIYFHLDDGEAVANFATNRGTGGNFTITGTLETGSTSPSD